ncbi:Hint domain-containing protein [Roseovarius sp. 2305UL8-3]|uniref:Hint domain-containing protein n=1 Tax=Roseovarius conchicola TaxID=3121636 RepID=UPI0035270BAF
MPTSYTDQFFVIDPGTPPAGGTALTVQKFDFIDQNDDGQITTTDGDTFNGLTITSVWVNDTITVNIPGTGNVTITGVTFYVAGGPAVFTPTDGTVLEDATFVSSTFVNTSTQIPVGSFGPPCFTRGTMIATPDGLCAVEDLKPGDKVLTRDNGPRPVLHISQGLFSATGRNAPVRICKGALGNTVDLWVSQQHRMLIDDWRAQVYFGEDEVLVAAKHLVNGDTIYVDDGDQVEYFHLLFDGHQIIWGAGIPSESYFPAQFAERADEQTLREIQRLFPDLCLFVGVLEQSARPVVPGKAAVLLAA